MANLFLNVTAPAGNGAGAAVDFSGFGTTKTIVVAGSWSLPPTINIEINNDAAQAGSWAPLATFQGAGARTLDVAARWIRARVSNFRGGQAPQVDIGGADTGTDFAALPVPAANGVGAAVDVSALGLFKTVQVGDAFRGSLIIELSEDGATDWGTFLAFNAPGQNSKVAAANWARVRRSGVPGVNPGTPIVNLAAVDVSGGGGGTVNVDPNTIAGDGSVADPLQTIGFRTANVTVEDTFSWIHDATRIDDRITVYLRNAQNSGENHGESITLQVDNESIHDCTTTGKQAKSIEVNSFATRSAGAFPLTNIALQVSASGAQENYAYKSGEGSMRHDGQAVFGGVDLAGGFTIGPGVVAGADAIQFNGNVTVMPEKSFSPGLNVAPFIIPGSAVLNPSIAIGWTAGSISTQIATKNTVAANADCGVEVHIDTTLNAGARGGIVIYRSAGGAGEVAGFTVPGQANVYAVGALENDALVWSYDPGSAGRRVAFATGAAPTVCGFFETNGLFQVLAGMMHTGNLGFYGTAPIAQQVGVAVSAAGIHAALVALGLITA